MMIFRRMLGLLIHTEEWKHIKNEKRSLFNIYINCLIPLAAIPVVSAFIGSSQIGWKVSKYTPEQMLTPESSLVMSMVAFGVILIGAFIMGCFIYWMERNYGSNANLKQCTIFAIYTASPFLISGAATIYPQMYFMIPIMLIGIAWTTCLLYTGLPIFMGISWEQGFVFASAIVCVGLVGLVALFAVSVILWNLGFGPVYV